SHTQREIQRVINYVPFALASRHSGATVEVVDPLECEDVPVQCVYENFVPNREGLSGVLFGWLRGEQTKGIEEQEMLLEEGATLTGFGTLATEKGTDAVRLIPPADGSCYYLTHLSHPALVSKLKSEVDVLRVACFVFGFTAAGLSVYILLSWWQRRQRRIQEMKDATRREEAKKERRKQTRDATVASEYPNCVICLSNPVEVMMLECGHVCVCTDCAEQRRHHLHSVGSVGIFARERLSEDEQQSRYVVRVALGAGTKSEGVKSCLKTEPSCANSHKPHSIHVMPAVDASVEG
ncbi:unnamed protein product, partial [Ixodes persulcatus]